MTNTVAVLLFAAAAIIVATSFGSGLFGGFPKNAWSGDPGWNHRASFSAGFGSAGIALAVAGALVWIAAR